MDYRKLGIKEMVEWIGENDNTKEAKSAFNAAAVIEKKVTKRHYLLDEFNKPILNEAGKQKYELVETGEVKKSVAIMAAKKYFYETYKDRIEFTNAPVEKKQSLVEFLEEWAK